MLRVFVDLDNCRGCEPCTARPVCKTRALMQMDPGEPAWVEADRCSGCGDCLTACPHGAIDWTTVRIAAR